MMFLFRNILYIFCLVLLAACGDGSRQRPVIAVSVEPQRYLLEQLAGDRFHVVTLMKPGANPETFEPTMTTRRELDQAVAYFYSGGLPFERAMLQSAGPRLTLSTSQGIVPIYGTHSHHHDDDGHGHSAGEADPHVWTSVKNARIMATNMAHGLARLDPADSALYYQRLQKLCGHLDSLDSAISARLAAGADSCFMVWHPSLGYFARDYGLEQLSVGWESKEPSAAALRRVIDHAHSHGVRVFFYQREFDARQTRALTSQLGLRTVTIDPLGYDWPEQMNLITDELAK